MKLMPLLLGTALLAPMGLIGCSGNGQTPGEKIQVMQVKDEDKSLGHRVKEDLRDSKDALNITPRVKSAIIGDSQLNDKRNHINVNTKDYVLHLTGHVYSKAIKAHAGSVAASKLKEIHKNYKVSNELSIAK